MVKPFTLLKCIGVAVLKAAVRAIPFGEAISDLAHDVYTEWSKEKKADERRAELQAVAQAAAGEVRAQIQEIVQEIAGNQPTEIQETIKSYLHQVPSAIHQSLRRPSDPTGTTLPPSLQVLKEEDLIPFLPAKLPRFKPGDRPLHGVDWELTDLLGVGGFGEVWKARNPHFDSVPPVALKFCLDPAAKDRLLRHEAAVLNQAMRQGRHSGIIPLLRTYLSADPPCLEYQYVEGGDLGGFIAQRPQGSRALPVETATTIILRLAKIVGYAHRLAPPIVHRDLKPANILLEKAPDNKFHLRIADFGIGGLAAGREIDQTKQGLRPGELITAVVRGAYTLLYASPQQIRGMPPDPRDDVHALGVIWYQLLIGDLGAGRPGGRAWRNRLLEKGMRPALLDLLEACFEDNPGDRPRDAAILAEELLNRLAPQIGGEMSRSSKEAIDTSQRDTGAAIQKVESQKHHDASRHLGTGGELEKTAHERQEGKFNAEYPSLPSVPDAASFKTKPPTLRAGEISYLGEHSAKVRCLSFSFDGRYIASGGNDKVIRIWESETRSLVKELMGHEAAVSCLAFSRDGTFLSSGDEAATIHQWDLKRREPLGVMSGHSKKITALVYSPDDKLLLSCSSDNSVRLWSRVDNRELVNLRWGHVDATAVAFLDEGLIVAGGLGVLMGTAPIFRKWDAFKYKPISTFPRRTGIISFLSFSNDGNYAVFGKTNNTMKTTTTTGIISVWDVMKEKGNRSAGSVTWGS